MLTVIYGNVGSGKTLLLTILGYYLKSDIVSNYQLFYQKPKYNISKFEISTFVKAEYNNCSILMDEAYVYLESRISMSSKNKAFSYILFQSRKKSVNMYLTVQLISTIDRRYRDMFDMSINAHGFNGVEFVYSIYNHHTKETKLIKLNENKIRGFYSLFDTNEIIKPDSSIINQFLTVHEREERLEILKKAYLKQTQVEKITKGSVKLFLFRENMPMNYLDLLYQILKEHKEIEKKNDKST